MKNWMNSLKLAAAAVIAGGMTAMAGNALDFTMNDIDGKPVDLKQYTGKVVFIAADAEFTPKQIQTAEERVKLVYRVKVNVENPNLELKLNMPVDGEIALGAR